MDSNSASIPASWRNNRKVAIAPPTIAAADEKQHKICPKPIAAASKKTGTRKSSSPRNRKNNKGRKPTANKSKHSNKRPKQQDIISDEEKSRYIALDAEMVGIGSDGISSALARVTIVDWSGNIVYDTHVQVNRPVTDYRTFVSGITAQHLQPENGAIPFDECRAKVASILHGKILVGHALKNDLAVLRIHHPWQDIRDTAKYEPFMKTRFDDGILWPRKLRDLCKERLDKDIQKIGETHNPIEDATSALDLYKSVRTKWEKTMQYKIKKTNEIMKRKNEVEAERAVVQQQQQQQQHVFKSSSLVAMPSAVECSIGLAA